MDLKKRERLMALVAVICLGAWMGDHLVLSPFRAAWTKRSQQIVELEKSLARGRALVARETYIREQWQEMKRRGLPTDVSVAENQVLQSLSRWSQQSRLGVT